MLFFKAGRSSFTKTTDMLLLLRRLVCRGYNSCCCCCCCRSWFHRCILQKFGVGERVRVELDEARAIRLQEHFGGWLNNMKQVRVHNIRSCTYRCIALL